MDKIELWKLICNNMKCGHEFEHPLRQVRFSFDQPAQAVAETRSVVGIGALALVARWP